MTFRGRVKKSKLNLVGEGGGKRLEGLISIGEDGTPGFTRLYVSRLGDTYNLDKDSVGVLGHNTNRNKWW